MGFGKMRAGLALAGATLVLSQAASAATYSGNGGTGFGGPIGGSTLTVTDGGATINFSLATSGFGGNGLAIYLDTVAGGATSTSSFTDNADGGRTVLSGNGGGNGKSNAIFASGFGADYGISVEPDNGGSGAAGNGFAGIFNLSTPANFGFVASGGLSPTASTTLNFSVNKSDVGLPATGGGFKFVASLISTSAYRSNETIGASTTTGAAGDAPNAGFNGTTTFSAFNTFGTVPEPTTLGVVAAAAIGVLRRRRTA